MSYLTDQNSGDASTQEKLPSKVTCVGSIVAKLYWIKYERVPSSNDSAGGRRHSISQAPSTMPHDVVRKEVFQNDQVSEKTLKGSAVSHQAK